MHLYAKDMFAAVRPSTHSTRWFLQAEPSVEAYNTGKIKDSRWGELFYPAVFSLAAYPLGIATVFFVLYAISTPVRKGSTTNPHPAHDWVRAILDFITNRWGQ